MKSGTYVSLNIRRSKMSDDAVLTSDDSAFQAREAAAGKARRRTLTDVLRVEPASQSQSTSPAGWTDWERYDGALLFRPLVGPYAESQYTRRVVVDDAAGAGHWPASSRAMVAAAADRAR